jgi:hypothetical protein
VLAIASPAFAQQEEDLAAAKRATAEYVDVAEALADGYAQDGPCVDDPLGAMGFHYTNPAYLNDGLHDVTKPDQLLYAPSTSGRGLKLVGVEYHQDDADQDLNTAPDRPTLFDLPFDGPMPGHAPGAPVHYDLHVWIWQTNPSGMFAQWNPTVPCDLAIRSFTVPKRLRAARTVAGGIPVRINVGEAGSTIEARLFLGQRVIGRSKRKFNRAGRRKLVVRPTLRGVRAVDERLRRKPRVRLSLRLAAKQPTGIREKRSAKLTLTR